MRPLHVLIALFFLVAVATRGCDLMMSRAYSSHRDNSYSGPGVGPGQLWQPAAERAPIEDKLRRDLERAVEGARTAEHIKVRRPDGGMVELTRPEDIAMARRVMAAGWEKQAASAGITLQPPAPRPRGSISFEPGQPMVDARGAPPN